MATEMERRHEAVQDFLAMLLHGDLELTDRCAWRKDDGEVEELTDEVHRRYKLIKPIEEI